MRQPSCDTRHLNTPLQRGRLRRLAHRQLLTFCILLITAPVSADIYIYHGPDGERLFADKPIIASAPEYTLIKHRRIRNNASPILANRPLKGATLGRSAADYRNLIEDASDQYQIDPLLVEAVIQIESGFNPNAVSGKGAAGLMQLMQDTAADYHVNDRFNPRENIHAGVQHLRYLMDRFSDQVPLVLAAYNAGAGSVDKYRGIPPFPETRRYVIKVLEHHIQLRAIDTHRQPTMSGGDG
jgi:soluble lytic murein transglycosylase-like protein